MTRIAIVGGGFSGVTLAIQLLRRAAAGDEVTVIERGETLGRGIAFGVHAPIVRLNVPASRMSIDPDDPDDFVRWAGAGATPHAFLPRARYGAYVEERLAAARHGARATFRVVRGEAIAIAGSEVVLADASRIAADHVVLATGLTPRASDPRCIDGWSEQALTTLPAEGDLLILGAGLSALDVLAVLDARAFRGTLTIASRRRLLPRPHGAPAAAPIALGELPSDLRGVMRHLRVLARTRPWQHVLDALRPHVAALWRGFSLADRRAFLRHVRVYWEVLRHRAPPELLILVERWRAEGRLVLADARVVDLAAFHRVIRCTGPALDADLASPLVRSLLDGGLARPDPAGLGIVTDAAGLIGPGLHALGAPRRASSWETTAVPELTVHARDLAKRLLGPA